MSLFGGNLGGQQQPERKTGTLFGSTTGPPGGLFANSQPAQQQPAAGGLFGNTTTNTQQNTGGGLFGNSTANAQPSTGGGLFGHTTTNTQQQQNTGGGLFGNISSNAQSNTGGGLFGNINQSQQQQQPQQQPSMTSSFIGGIVRPAPTLSQAQYAQLQQQSQQHTLPRLRQSIGDKIASASMVGAREKSVIDQIKVIVDKWDPAHPDCAFQYYFYNSVKPEEAPFYGPGANEDHKKWEEALANKPSEGSIPLLARGFEDMAARIQYQVFAMNSLQKRMHEMNNCLNLIKDQHELKTGLRITEAKRKHIEQTQRTLALATKVQILRNRGYAMDQAEEELKKKLAELEKRAFDPVNGGRQEEIWARMSGVRERAQQLQNETERLGNAAATAQDGAVLSEEDQAQLEKILKGYDAQLQHLKKMVDDTKQEYEDWEKEQTQPPRFATGRR